MKTKPTSQKTAWALATAVALTLSGALVASERNVTDYDRKTKEQNGQTDIWSRVNIGSSPASVEGRQLEKGSQNVEAASLNNSWERMTQSADFTDLRDRVDNHEIRITDLEGRVTNLEDQPGNWQPGSPEAGGWQPVGSPGRSLWSPEISNQEADFTQSRTVQQPVQRTVNVYETNAVTGERRLVDTYTETDTQTSTETRLIDVANNPGGGTDGWSAWQNVGSPNCSSATWSPATSTVNQGQTFTQTRNCTQTQRSFIYYLADGDLLETRSRDIGVNAPQSRSAVGTKTTTSCKFDYERISSQTYRPINLMREDRINSDGDTEVVIYWDRNQIRTGSDNYPTEIRPFISGGYKWWRPNNPKQIRNPNFFEVCRESL